MGFDQGPVRKEAAQGRAKAGNSRLGKVWQGCGEGMPMSERIRNGRELPTMSMHGRIVPGQGS
jgi:hypothetical protein